MGILILRRAEGGRLKLIFQTDMQRIAGNCQAPLQIARVDDSIDPNFDESVAIEVIEKGSAVHCVSALEGDIVVLGSDGVFDNLFVEEIVHICDAVLFPHWQQQSITGRHSCVDRRHLAQLARNIVREAHAKADGGNFRKDTPIGRGGKVDDTSCVVAEVIEWVEEHTDAWVRIRRQQQLRSLITCSITIPGCDGGGDDDSETHTPRRAAFMPRRQQYPSSPTGSFTTYAGSFSEYGYGGGISRGFPQSRPTEQEGSSTRSSSVDSDIDSDWGPETRQVRPKIPYGCNNAEVSCSIA